MLLGVRQKWQKQHRPMRRITRQVPVLTDQELVTNILNGDDQSFAELVGRYEQAVYNLAYYMLHDWAEAEDSAQEAFLRVYRNLRRYDPTRSFKTWVMSIASNHCIDRLRRRRFQKFSLDEMLPYHPARQRIRRIKQRSFGSRYRMHRELS